MRWSSISVTSLRASSTGWTFVLKARPNRPSKRPSIFCSMLRSTFTAGVSPGSESSSRGRRAAAAGRARNGVPGHSSGGPWPARADRRIAAIQAAATSGSAAACGSARSVAPSRSVPNAAPPQGPRRRHAPTAAAAAASAIVSRASAGDADRPCPEGGERTERARCSREREVGRLAADDRQPATGERRDDRGGEHSRNGLGRAPRRPSGRDDDERQKRDRADGGEQWAREEEERRARPGPEDDEPGECGDAVERGEPERDVPERQDRHREREREPESRRRSRRGALRARPGASGQCAGKNAKVEVTQPARSAAGIAGARRGTTGGMRGTDRRGAGGAGPRRWRRAGGRRRAWRPAGASPDRSRASRRRAGSAASAGRVARLQAPAPRGRCAS